MSEANQRIRQATEEDVPFLIEAIIAAEKSGTDVLSYSSIYGLNPDEVDGLLEEALLSEIEGQELCIQHFTILEVDGSKAACLSSWVEENSAALKASVLGFLIPVEKLKAASAHQTLLSDLRIPRQKGALQLECVYVHPTHRGQGLLGKLVQHILSQSSQDVTHGQLIVDGSNQRAIRAYEKLGFRISLATSSQDALASGVLPSAKRCSMIINVA